VDLLAEQGIPAERTHHVPYGLFRQEDKACNRREAGEEQDFTVGYLGNIEMAKGVHVLISAFTRLKTGGKPLRLKIYGELKSGNAYHDRLTRKAAPFSGIGFMGRYDNSEVGEILGGLDVLVVPSLWFETGPLVVLEALDAGVPVVASSIPNMNDQITDGVNGLLFKVGDPRALASQMQRVYDNPGLLHELRQGISPVKPFEQEMDEIERIYCRVTASAGSSCREDRP
jgi:glycosyltransferase involved in cell wall biosynthesis